MGIITGGLEGRGTAGQRMAGRGAAWLGKARRGVSGVGGNTPSAPETIFGPAVTIAATMRYNGCTHRDTLPKGTTSVDIRFTFTGTAPLLMHSTRLANPLDPATKALKKVTAKTKKTDEDHERVAQLEFAGGLYIDDEIGPFVPGENIERCLLDAAKLTKAGMKLKRAMFVMTNENWLSYKGPRTTDTLWADDRFRLVAPVKVGMQRVMRTRPMFREWTLEADAILDPEQMDLDELVSIMERAGRLIGLGDWRPRYGRFQGTLEKL